MFAFFGFAMWNLLQATIANVSMNYYLKLQHYHYFQTRDRRCLSTTEAFSKQFWFWEIVIQRCENGSFLFFSETTSLSFLSRLSRVRLSSAAEMFRVRSQADASSAEGLRNERRVGHYIDLTETGNRAWKVASTQGTSRLASGRGYLTVVEQGIKWL